MTRRRLLGAASVVALSSAAVGEPEAAGEPWRGEPFDDGTCFDDGYGWAD